MSYIYICGGESSAHVLTHARILCITDHMHGANPQTGSPEPLGREGDVLVSFKGTERKGLDGKTQ